MQDAIKEQMQTDSDDAYGYGFWVDPESDDFDADWARWTAHFTHPSRWLYRRDDRRRL